MNIAIIGAGSVGRALAGSLTRAGHSVTVAARTPKHAAETAAATGARPAASSVEAVESAEVAVLAVPWAAAEAVAREIRSAARGKVVVDVINPMSATGDSAVEDGRSTAEHIQEWLPDARVVKAFNTMFAAVQANTTLHGTPADALLAGDDADARQLIAELARSMGARPIDAGPLRRARGLEALALLHIGLNMSDGWTWTSYVKLVGAPVEEPADAGAASRSERMAA